HYRPFSDVRRRRAPRPSLGSVTRLARFVSSTKVVAQRRCCSSALETARAWLSTSSANRSNAVGRDIFDLEALSRASWAPPARRLRLSSRSVLGTLALLLLTVGAYVAGRRTVPTAA